MKMAARHRYCARITTSCPLCFFPPKKKKRVGKSESTGRGPCGDSAATEEQCFPAAKAAPQSKALESRRGRGRGRTRLRGESARSDLITAVEKSHSATSSPHGAGEKKRRCQRAKEGSRPPYALVPEEKARSAPAGRRQGQQSWRGRDIASAMQFLALGLQHRCGDSVNDRTTRCCCLATRFLASLGLHMALGRPMGQQHSTRGGRYGKDKERI